MTAVVGYMPMPAGFRHADVFRRGRPFHGTPERPSTYDAFYRKHPPMAAGKRAKIFAPFDALRGFNARIASKEILYEHRRTLTEDEKDALDRKLSYLKAECAGSRSQNLPVNGMTAGITCFIPCRDPESEAFGSGKGNYITISGTVHRIDPLKRIIHVDDQAICINDIVEIMIPEVPDHDDGYFGA